jgi:hypothetical protein
MAIKSVLRGWECEGCGINRNEVNEVWKDCICDNEEKLKEVETSNTEYWNKF